MCQLATNFEDFLFAFIGADSQSGTLLEFTRRKFLFFQQWQPRRFPYYYRYFKTQYSSNWFTWDSEYRSKLKTKSVKNSVNLIIQLTRATPNQKPVIKSFTSLNFIFIKTMLFLLFFKKFINFFQLTMTWAYFNLSSKNHSYFLGTHKRQGYKPQLFVKLYYKRT